MTVLIVYVDDIVLIGNKLEDIQKMMQALAQEFEVKDLGRMRYFLGLEVARAKRGVLLPQ